MENLLQKKCKPCEGGMPPLSVEEFQPLLVQVPNWQVIENKALEREFEFQNFNKAMEFVNKVAELANQEDHHPDIFIHDYKKVKITLTTHALKGLSENDFIMGAKINNF